MERFMGRVVSLTHDGRGVVKIDGKVWFIDGAIPGETISFIKTGRRKSYGLGRIEEVVTASPERVVPDCNYFGVCGGCSLQHIDVAAQLRLKEKLVIDQMSKIGGIHISDLRPPIESPPWGYRRRARLSVRLVPKKGGVLVGFREKRKSYVTNLDLCMTLDRRVGGLLPSLQSLISSFSIPDKVPQVEVAVGDRDVALVFRHLAALGPGDLNNLGSYARTHQIQCYLQPGGKETVRPYFPVQPLMLEYGLENGSIRVQFSPTDFTQVNHTVNESLVATALGELELGAEDRVLDLFCGVGNFSLPIASRVSQVVGVENDPALVDRASQNASLNGFRNTEFQRRDLYEESLNSWCPGSFNKLIIDPPRSGAQEVAMGLVPRVRPQRIVYVSCNPATLARDSAILISNNKYRLQSLRVIDMFPHTTHVEVLAVFESGKRG